VLEKDNITADGRRWTLIKEFYEKETIPPAMPPYISRFDYLRSSASICGLI
jgi:hypothetical protein